MSKETQRFQLFKTTNAEEDLQYWQQSGNQKMLDRINRLISAACENPSQGIGKPERLKYYEFETYSRRIDNIHRLLYRVEGKNLVILSARFHYDDK